MSEVKKPRRRVYFKRDPWAQGKGRHQVFRHIPALFRSCTPYEQKFETKDTFGAGETAILRLRTKKLCRRALLWGILPAVLIAGLLAGSFVWRVSGVVSNGTERYAGADLAAAAGLNAGDRMLGFNASDVEKRLRTSFPLLSDVKVVRHVRGAVELRASEETAVYFTQHYMNWYLLSGTTNEVLYVDASPDAWKSVGAVYIGLPEEARLRRGERLTYEFLPYPHEGADREVSTYEVRKDTPGQEFAYVDEVLDTVMGSVIGPRVTGLELGDRYDVWFLIDGRVKVLLGSAQDVDLKMKNVISTLSSSDVSDLCVLDASTPERVSLRHQPDLVLPEWAAYTR